MFAMYVMFVDRWGVKWPLRENARKVKRNIFFFYVEINSNDFEKKKQIM